MMVVDLETSGGDFEKCGILQIGALDLENPENTFMEEARLNEDYEIVEAKNLGGNTKTVREVTGLTEENMRDKGRQSEKQLLEHFFAWIKKVKIRNFICLNPQFDYGFIWTKSNQYNLETPFYHRCMDLSTIAIVKYFELKGKFLTKEDHTDMGLKNILEFVGMEDKRDAHDALEDAKLEAECFSRLVYGKNLFPEFKKFPVPKGLKKK